MKEEIIIFSEPIAPPTKHTPFTGFMHKNNSIITIAEKYNNTKTKS